MRSSATTLVDTSAFLALLNRLDLSHDAAVGWWSAALEADEPMLTTSYVLIETTSLAQARLGTEAVRVLHDGFLGVVPVQWTDRKDHDEAVTHVVASGRRSLSVVDRMSFLIMRRFGVERAFAFDPHFREEGFELVP